MALFKAVWFLIGGGCLVGLAACGGASKSSSAGSGGASAASAGGDAGSGAEGALSPGGGTTGAGASAATDGRSGFGGAPIGGRPSIGGSGGGAGAGTAAAAGASACIVGASCNCGSRVGTTTCAHDKAECSCPPSSECNNEPGARCFEPCGGDPFGIWRLEESCFAGARLSTSPECKPFIGATATDNELTLRIVDGGELSGYGHETWTVASHVPLACLGIESVNRCKDATFYTGLAFFSQSSSSGGSCVANACGVCDCEGMEASGWSGSSSWSRSGSKLTLGDVTFDYCVQGDQMWIGGAAADGSPKVAYRLSKHSCMGKPIPCADRTPEQCELSGSCIAGHCKGKSAADTGCASAWSQDVCDITEGCVWETGGCYGDAAPGCDISNCDTDPGCSWGAPVQHCAGEAFPCCQTVLSESGDCSLLDATSCSKAQGCTLLGGTCTGEPSCYDQTDSAICGALGCQYTPGCTPVSCSALSAASCHSMQGCHIEW
ncbi:MAG: hypothetical protein ABUL62_02555 [Myxococcales bacterium]